MQLAVPLRRASRTIRTSEVAVDEPRRRGIVKKMKKAKKTTKRTSKAGKAKASRKRSGVKNRSAKKVAKVRRTPPAVPKAREAAVQQPLLPSEQVAFNAGKIQL
jgi:hypothetical protein